MFRYSGSYKGEENILIFVFFCLILPVVGIWLLEGEWKKYTEFVSLVMIVIIILGQTNLLLYYLLRPFEDSGSSFKVMWVPQDLWVSLGGLFGVFLPTMIVILSPIPLLKNKINDKFEVKQIQVDQLYVSNNLDNITSSLESLHCMNEEEFLRTKMIRNLSELSCKIDSLESQKNRLSLKNQQLTKDNNFLKSRNARLWIITSLSGLIITIIGGFTVKIFSDFSTVKNNVMIDLKVGSKVWINSKEPIMTVMSKSKDLVECMWFDENKNLKTHSFKKETLTII